MSDISGAVIAGSPTTGIMPEFAIPGANALAGNRRALASALLAAGNDVVKINDAILTRREALAHAIWNAILAGEVVFTDGRLLQIDDMDQWTSLVKWLHSHIDGPVMTASDSRATNAVVRVVWNDVEVAKVDVPVANDAAYDND